MIRNIQFKPNNSQNYNGSVDFYDIKSKFNNVELNDIMICLIGFLVSRATVMNGMIPFGIAFLSAYLLRKRLSLVVSLIVCVGVLSISRTGSLPYLICIAALFWTYQLLKNKIKFTTLKIAMLASVLLVGVKMMFVIEGSYYLYDLIMICFEGIIVFALTYIFTYSIAMMEGSYNRFFTSEETISGAIMLSLTISGIGQASLYSLSIKTIIAVIIVLVLSNNKGPSMGTAVGVTIGLITSMSTPNMPFIIAIYGLAGLLSGLFKDLGKFGSCLGFCVGSGIMTFYINNFSEYIIGIKEILIACFIFIILGNMINKLNDKIFPVLVQNDSVKLDYNNRIKDITYKRLSEFASVFEELGATFSKVAEKERVVEQKDVSKFVNCVVENVCSDCSMYRYCWENDFYSTYQSMFKMMSIIENNGVVTEKTLPSNLKKRCIKHKKLINKSNYLFDLYKINYEWENKIIESRELVSQQLKGVSDVIKELADEVHKDIDFKEDVEKAVYSELRNANVNIKDVTVTESQGQQFEIYLETNNVTDLDEIINIVSNVVGLQLTRDKFYRSELTNGRMKLKLIKSNRYGAITRVSKQNDSFNYISGDSYTFGERQGNYYSILSDGMGVGQKANQESDITISLLEKFLEAGYNKELALKTINSILVLKSNEEIFATLDMAIVDLYNGKAQFIKTGSASTFIKKKDKVKIINSESLPIGILRDVDFEVYEEKLEDGDFIIQMSDGVLDANYYTDDKEKWMEEIIKSMDNVNPQSISNKIIDEACKICDDKHKDDMTVLVTKIWKRIH